MAGFAATALTGTATLSGCGGGRDLEAGSIYQGTYDGSLETFGGPSGTTGRVNLSVDTNGRLVGNIQGTDGSVSSIEGKIKNNAEIEGTVIKRSLGSLRYSFTGKMTKQQVDQNAILEFNRSLPVPVPYTRSRQQATPTPTPSTAPTPPPVQFVEGAIANINISLDGTTYPGRIYVQGGTTFTE